jgi:hypothetical protein
MKTINISRRANFFSGNMDGFIYLILKATGQGLETQMEAQSTRS